MPMLSAVLSTPLSGAPSSPSGSRSNRLYSFSTTAKPRSPCSAATRAASSSCAGEKLEHPISRTRPRSSNAFITSSVSLSGVRGSGLW